MNQNLRKEAEDYELKSLKNSLKQYDENIASIEDAIVAQEEHIDQEREIIGALSADKALDKEHARIDIGRLQDNISRHKSEIDNFKAAVEEERTLKSRTEKLITYKELEDGS